MIQLLKTKIQELIVTESSLDYPGSISLPEPIIKAAGLHVFELVYVNNKTSGQRITTYVVKSKTDDFVSLNGAAAHHFKKGDLIHVLAFCTLSEQRAKKHVPILVKTSDNKLVSVEPYEL